MIIKIIEEYGALIGILSIIGIEILPIKISPITFIGKMWSKFIGIDEIHKKINILEKKVDKNIEETNKNELDRIRYEILQFSGSLRNGLKRTQNDYQHIEEIYFKYTKKGGNSYIHSEMDFIRKCRNKIDIKKQ